MWLRLMAIAFFANGLGPFGLRILEDKGLLAPYRLPYLALWYAGGLILAALAYLRKPERMHRSEIVLGAVMACCSLGGQLATALAWSRFLDTSRSPSPLVAICSLLPPPEFWFSGSV